MTLVFNNAGLQGEFVPIHKYPIAEARRVIEVNVIGALNVPIVYMSVRWWKTLHQIQSSPSTVDPSYALGLRAQGLTEPRTYVLVGDAELDEGSNHEAIQYAGAIGLSGQMHGSVFLDKKGNVVRKALLWNDQRTAAECEEIEKRAGGRDEATEAGDQADDQDDETFENREGILPDEPLGEVPVHHRGDRLPVHVANPPDAHGEARVGGEARQRLVLAVVGVVEQVDHLQRDPRAGAAAGRVGSQGPGVRSGMLGALLDWLLSFQVYLPIAELSVFDNVVFGLRVHNERKALNRKILDEAVEKGYVAKTPGFEVVGVAHTGAEIDAQLVHVHGSSL